MNKEAKEKVCYKIAEILAECLSLIEEPEKDSGPRLYSTQELSERFGKSKSTIRQWMANGYFGEIVQVGSSPMATEEGLQKYISDHSGPCRSRKKEKITRRVPCRNDAGRI